MSYPQLLSPEEMLADAMRRLGIEDVVVLCGSMRFADQMAEVAVEESVLRRALVLKPDVNMKHPHPLWANPVDAEALKARLDDQHRQKIRLAHRVIVVGDYAGDSTRSEIAYARELGKPVRFTDSTLAAEFATTTPWPPPPVPGPDRPGTQKGTAMTTPVPDGACPTAGCLRPVGHNDTHCVVPSEASDDDLCTSQFHGDGLHFGQLCNLLVGHDGSHSAFAEIGPGWRRHLVWAADTPGEAPGA